MIFFITVFLAFCAFGVDAAIIYTIREKLQNSTEATALAAASYFGKKNVMQSDITAKADEVFNILKLDNLQSAKMTTNVNMAQKEILVTTEMNAPTFFLAFIGVANINLNAKACAQSEPLSVTAKYGYVNWLTASAAYLSDVISKGINLNDTAILLPLGNFPLASYNMATNTVNFDYLDKEDNKPLSLGPGGFVTIKLPNPIIDKPGNDLYISESGTQEGYMVFAGLDVDPNYPADSDTNNQTTGPYIQYDRPGAGIKWINITCSGTPTGTGIGQGIAAGTNFGAITKFYGSANFDLGAACLAAKNISMAKYIRIIDDNAEDGYANGNFLHLYGEASTATAGADINSVTVLNHVKLIAPSTFTP